MPLQTVKRINATSSCTLAFNMLGKRAKIAEDALVVRMVRPQLHAVAFGHRQGNLERIDGIQAQVTPEQRRFRVDRGRIEGFQIKRFNDQDGQFVFGSGLRGHA